jgi:O-antigen/teichoic acid export membrane protein
LWPILRVGGAFFLLQMTSLVLFNLGTYLTYSYYSASAAARYDVLNKVFQIPMTLFNVVISVVWGVIANRLAQRDRMIVGQIQRQLLAASVGGGFLVMLLAYWVVQPFVHFYTHGRIEVIQVEVSAFAAQTMVQMVAYAGAVFMNAAERLRVQIAFAVASMLAFLPLFHLLHGRGFGIEAVPLATLLVLLPGAFYFHYYVRHHIIAPLAST